MNEHILKNFWVRLDKFLGPLVMVGIFCLIFVLAHRAIFDLDIWLHLKTGEFILQNKTIPSKDIFSFTLPGKTWIDHSWLFQLIAYLVYSKWQIDGLIFLESIAITLPFLVLFLLGYQTIKSYLEVVIFILITAYASLSRFNIRPDMFSLLFFALYLFLLRLYIDKRLIWLLVPVQALWVNFHGYFFLGPLLVFFFITAEFLRRKLFKFLPWQWREEFALSDLAYRHLKRLFLLVVLACLFNPNGFQGAFYPLYVLKEVLSGRIQIFLKYIQELQPTFSMTVQLNKFYYFLITFCFSLMAINFKRLKLIEIFLAIFFFFFSLSLRNIAFFLFICNMIVVSYLGVVLKKIPTHVQFQSHSWQRIYFLSRHIATIILIVWSGLKINRTLSQNYYDFENKEAKSYLMGIDYRNYPKKAVDFILENDIPGNMFNDFNSGAYLIGSTYPKRKVFIDGRTEFYGPDFFKEYMNLMKGDISAFQKIIDKYDISSILVSTALTSVPDIVGYIYKSPQWKLVFFDESGVIFLKDVPENYELIKRYKIDLSKYAVPKLDLKELRLKAPYPAPYIKRAALFNLLKEDASIISECKEALRIMPNCAEGYHLMGKMYLRKGLYQDALENLRSALVLLPGNAEALVDLGICYQELKDTKSSLDILKRAVRINRRYAPAYYRLGRVYLTINNHDGAIRVLRKAVKYEPEKAHYHFKLGEAFYEKAKKLKKDSYLMQAEQELNKAREINSGYQDKELNKEIEDKLKEIEDYKKNRARPFS